jgi:hypothetical protein
VREGMNEVKVKGDSFPLGQPKHGKPAVMKLSTIAGERFRVLPVEADGAPITFSQKDPSFFEQLPDGGNFETEQVSTRIAVDLLGSVSPLNVFGDLRIGVGRVEFSAREDENIGGEFAADMPSNHEAEEGGCREAGMRGCRGLRGRGCGFNEDDGGGVNWGDGLEGQAGTRSKMALMPWPTPMHMVARP